MVEGERLQMGGESAAGPEPAAGLPHHLGTDAVVADEGHVAAALAAGRGLADVVQDGAEAQRGAPGHVVGQRLLEQRPRLRGALAGEAVEVRLDGQRLLEHRQRVAVDVEVVVGPLLDVAQLGELGEDDRRDAELVEQGEAAQRVAAADQLPQLDELPLPGRLAGARGAGPGQLGRALLDRQLELGRQPGCAQQAQGVRREAALADRTQKAPVEVGEPAERIDRLPPGERHRDGADGEVALAEVVLDPRSANRREVDLPGLLAVDDAPGLELGRELEGVGSRGGGDCPGGALGIAGDGEIEVGDVGPEDGVADGAADDPGVGPGAGQCPAGELDDRRRGQSLAQAHRRPPALTPPRAAPGRRSRR